MTSQRSYLSDAERAQDMMQSPPRQRISMNRATPLALTGAWQAIPYAAGASTSDMCSFPESRFDFATGLIKPNPWTGFEQSYTLSMDLGVTINAANTGVKLSIRFAIPRPAEAGGPVYFPLPDSLQRVDLPDEVIGPNAAVHFDYIVHTNTLVRTHGAQVQLRATSFQLSSGGLLGGLVGALAISPSGNQRPTLTDAVLNIFSI